MEKVRDLTLDIVKAICIMLMVVGHSGCPTYLHDFLYLFHMPCFFFISGWLLSDKYIDDLKTGLLKKVKGSYVPFVKWTLIFLLFHNVFASVHIYADSYSWQTFIERVVRTFTMTGGESLLGGFWFLISLFWASVWSVLFLHFLYRNRILTFVNIWGGGNYSPHNYNILALSTNFATSNVRRTNITGNNFLSERICLP